MFLWLQIDKTDISRSWSKFKFRLRYCNLWRVNDGKRNKVAFPPQRTKNQILLEGPFLLQMIGCQVSLYLGWVYCEEDDLISLRRKPESRFQSHTLWKIQSLVNSANCHFCQSADGNIYQDIGTYLYKTSLVHHVQLILSPPHCLLFVHLSPGFCVIMVNSSNVIWRFVVCILYLIFVGITAMAGLKKRLFPWTKAKPLPTGDQIAAWRVRYGTYGIYQSEKMGY